MEAKLFGQIAISLLLGLLIGLQRERAESAIGGIRTFPLIAAFGTVCGWMGLEYGGWIVPAGLLAVAALLLVSNFMSARAGNADAGQTSEIAALLLYAVGAYLVTGALAVAVALGGVIAILLHFKDPLHAFASRIGEQDVTAIMQFALISLVVLPVLPNRAFGPYETLNPFQIWLMVVLIVGIGLVGYVAYKLLGAKQGALLGGIVGGLVSSTATTVSFARRAAASPAGAGLAALVIMTATGVVYVRVMTEVAVVAPQQLRAMLPPLGAMLFACAVIVAVQTLRYRERKAAAAEQGNPANLRLAITFAALYAVISFVVVAAQARFGVEALYPVAVISGLTDMDAITLSTSLLVNSGGLDAGTAWRVILLASLSNLLFKGIMAAVLGGRSLVAHLAPAFGAALLAGSAILAFWPAAV
jgi:uncharacterized membrane protein (DUF4010 family)